MEARLSFKQWSALDAAYQRCCTTPSSQVAPFFSQLHHLLIAMNLASQEEDSYKELADIARHWLSTHYLADLPPRSEAGRLWKHWKRVHGEHIENHMSADFKEMFTPRIGYIYVLKMASWYKIGRSNHVLKRFPQIAVHLPLPTRLWMIFFSLDATENEARMHDYYAPFHTNGEWFALPDSEAARLYTAQPYLDSYWLVSLPNKLEENQNG